MPLDRDPRNQDARDVYNQIKLFTPMTSRCAIDPPNLKEYFRRIDKVNAGFRISSCTF